jgi:hypothetical protein
MFLFRTPMQEPPPRHYHAIRIPAGLQPARILTHSADQQGGGRSPPPILAVLTDSG